ncbi:hypothetical protein AALP_AA6G200900 [Arabis alpina]|uniref:Uncharacterized protein n=1 Tax=Arabis alpina TaxID=50452 RepID=A0A087GQG8_ARAAL|nr:hypothetical protein AALP_AA6G200900 [Arabis alpina]
MTDERRITDPKDAELRDLEDGEIQTDGSIREDQTARHDPPPAAPTRANPPGEKSKEVPRATSLLHELLQKMSMILDALLETVERQNRAIRMITDELKSLGADFRARALEPAAAVVDHCQRRRSALLAQAQREKSKVGDKPIDLDDDEDLARRVVPDTELTYTERARQAATKARIADPRQATSQQFSTLGDNGPARRVMRDAELPEGEMARQTTENVEWVEQTEVTEAKQAAVRAQHDEMAEFRVSLSKTTIELKTIRSQMHCATSKASEIDMILEQAQHTLSQYASPKQKCRTQGRLEYQATMEPKIQLTTLMNSMWR